MLSAVRLHGIETIKTRMKSEREKIQFVHFNEMRPQLNDVNQHQTHMKWSFIKSIGGISRI